MVPLRRRLRLKPSAYIEMMRPLNCVMMAVAVYVAAVVGSSGLPSFDPRVWYALATAFLLAGFAMVVNDISDVEVDRVNEPHRPLPSGRATVSGSKAFATLLAVLGVALSFGDGLLEAALAVLSVVLSVAYSRRLKKSGLPGNLAVSYNVALPFLYGGIVTGGLKPVLAVFFALAFLSNTGREIVKGIAEAKGDALSGAKTLALVHGPKVASRTAATFSLLAVAFSPLPLLFKDMSALGYGLPVALADIGFLYLVTELLARPENTETAKKVRRLYKVPMFVAIVSFLAGALL
ncbi:MAG: geranylgeranylglycerol-phosphate geranylgeranyltransferase [Thermoprotei archaeon]